MNKKTQRLIYLISLVAILLFVIFAFTLPPTSRDISSAKETVPVVTETTPTEITVPETTEEVTEPTEATVPTTEPIVEETEPATEPVPKPIKETVRYAGAYSYTDYELDLLARLVQAEGGGESYYTKLRIASVVMNRVSDPDYHADTIEGVIYAKNQFSVTFLRVNGVIMIDRPASEESIRAAKEILDYGSVLPQKVQVFYARGCTEPWVTSRVVYEVSDNTVFSYIYS